MLIGQKELTIDEKGRLVLPSIYRDSFTENLCYASLGMDGCMVLYPKESYLKKEATFLALDDFDPEARKVKRIFLANSFDLTIDSHNRVLLPKRLLDKLNIKNKVTLIGSGDCLELFSTDKYEAMMEADEKDYSLTAKRLTGK